MTSRTRFQHPQRIALLKPCCIGDVVFATALLEAIHRAQPAAAIDWLVSRWAAPVIDGHPALRQTIVIGDGANPAHGIRAVLRVAGQLRVGHYDWLFVPDRSPWLSLAAWLSRIPRRIGLDSGGRGFGYTDRAAIVPTDIRHEAAIYLDLARLLNIPTVTCWANVPPRPADQAAVRELLTAIAPEALTRPLLIVHPGGGINPGMVLVSKRWPTNCVALLTKRVVDYIEGEVVILGAASDAEAVRALRVALPADIRPIDLSERLTLGQIAALAALPNVRLYLGNDTGSAHLAAAAGARTLVIFGPSDPRRYAPYAPPDRVAYAWRPVAVPQDGVAGGALVSFDWGRDGVSVAAAWERAYTLLS